MSNVPDIKKETVDIVTGRIKDLENKGEIEFPINYSPQNALRSAWLILQNTIDREKKPVLQSCDKVSIMNSLFDMVVQGLNPAKKQVYFIAYGKQLVCQRSYHGTMALAKMVDPSIGEIVAEVIWQGDEFEYEIFRGKKRVVSHKQKLANIDKKQPIGAYCEILDHNGEVKTTTIMTFNQIKSAWKKSPMRPVGDNGEIKAGSTHHEYLEEMLKKTVIGRACKPVINSSSDSHLVRAATRSEQIQNDQEADRQELEHANQDYIDVVTEAVPKPAPEEEQVATSEDDNQTGPEPGPEDQDPQPMQPLQNGYAGPGF